MMEGFEPFAIVVDTDVEDGRQMVAAKQRRGLGSVFAR